MMQRIATNAEGERVLITIDGDVLDAIAYAYYGKHAKNTEELLEANPHVLDLGPVLSAGLIIKLPTITQEEQPKPFRKLWD